MSSATVYKIDKKGYLLFGLIKTVSGFGIGTDPYIQVQEKDMNATIADALKKVLNIDDAKRVADPTDWGEYSKVFLQKTGLKSANELNKISTLCCSVRREDSNIVFTPTKHAEPPDQGFVNKSKDEPNITVAYDASNEEIVDAFSLAFSKCE
ncbi:MAG: hypothetical protein J0I41_24260 [Filimonas sp.]|nr:hypothetical protein [Filimonas sp.]